MPRKKSFSQTCLIAWFSLEEFAVFSVSHAFPSPSRLALPWKLEGEHPFSKSIVARIPVSLKNRHRRLGIV